MSNSSKTTSVEAAVCRLMGLGGIIVGSQAVRLWNEEHKTDLKLPLPNDWDIYFPGTTETNLLVRIGNLANDCGLTYKDRSFFGGSGKRVIDLIFGKEKKLQTEKIEREIKIIGEFKVLSPKRLLATYREYVDDTIRNNPDDLQKIKVLERIVEICNSPQKKRDRSRGRSRFSGKKLKFRLLSLSPSPSRSNSPVRKSLSF